MTPELLDFLQKTHAEYCHYGQHEIIGINASGATQDTGSQSHLEIWDDFTKLVVASGPASRFMTFVDENNHSQLVAPYLALKSTELGSLCLSTSSASIVNQVTTYLEQRQLPCYRDRLKRGPTRFRVQPRSIEQYRELKEFILSLHPASVLSEIGGDDLPSPPSLPMSEKAISFHGLHHVLVTDKLILLPLIPVCLKAAAPIKEEIASALFHCLKLGAKWSTVERHFRRVLPKAEFAALRASRTEQKSKLR